MGFLLKINSKEIQGITIEQWDRTASSRGGFFSYYAQEHLAKAFSVGDEAYIVLGDLIAEQNQALDFDYISNAVKTNSVYKLPGIFYIIRINKPKGFIHIYSSLFNLLPIYYCVDGSEIIASSCISKIIEFKGRDFFEIDKQYILERLFFNYSLFNRTHFEQIKLVKANYFLQIEETVREVKQFEISDLFVKTPIKGRGVLKQLSKLFVQRAKTYLPNEKFALSFTSGFDGRTLLSISQHYSMEVNAYAFGTKDSDDLTIPQQQAELLKIPFDSILLNSNYVHNYSFQKGMEMIERSCGTASFARAHYVYAAEILSQSTNYMITGNFGSELFRAMHNPGVMVSKELIDIFSSRNDDDWISKLRNSKKWSYLNPEADFEDAFKGLIASIKEFKGKINHLSINQAFYVFVLDEVFRKYFGPEIKMQQYYIVNRTPFIDYQFVEFLFKTYYCGLYSDFFTNNPIKRFKGQLLYAHILKEVKSPLFDMQTGKGYKPSDLLTHVGKINLVANLIRKKFFKKNVSIDPYAVSQSFKFNKGKWKSVPVLNEIYNENYISEKLNNSENADDLLINIISTNYYLSKMSDYG